jgi:hypothetical protein
MSGELRTSRLHRRWNFLWTNKEGDRAMPPDTKRPGEQNQTTQNNQQDMAVAETFPASDPPASMGGEGSTRAVPPAELMDQHRPVPYQAVTLRRCFPTTEAAKLALEGLVRDGPIERNSATLKRIGKEVELLIAVDPDDCQRLRALLARA